MTPVWAVPRGTEGVRIMVQGGIAHGMTAAECLAGSGLTEADLDDENAEIWAHQEFDVIRNLIAGLGDRPGVGIEVGVHSTLGRAGLLGFLILASPNLRQGVERILPYLALSPTHLRFSVETDDEYGYLVADDSELPTDVRSFIVERDFAGFVAATQGANLALTPTWAATTLDADRAAKLAELWGLPASDVRSGQCTNRLAATHEVLDMPSPLADANTARKLEHQCRDLLECRLSRVGVAGQVRSRLLHNPGELPTMQAIAEELHIDPRTLRRHLAAEGTSYRTLLDGVRRDLAVELLQQDLSVEEISRHLGYAETANFTHAFKRWEGTAPSYFRRSQ